jgi:hypothetical protein
MRSVMKARSTALPARRSSLGVAVGGDCLVPVAEAGEQVGLDGRQVG